MSNKMEIPWRLFSYFFYIKIDICEGFLIENWWFIDSDLNLMEFLFFFESFFYLNQQFFWFHWINILIEFQVVFYSLGFFSWRLEIFWIKLLKLKINICLSNMKGWININWFNFTKKRRTLKSGHGKTVQTSII
jgi:hypothetical protein